MFLLFVEWNFCSCHSCPEATNRLIPAKEHGAVQMNIAQANLNFDWWITVTCMTCGAPKSFTPSEPANWYLDTSSFSVRQGSFSCKIGKKLRKCMWMVVNSRGVESVSIFGHVSIQKLPPIRVRLSSLPWRSVMMARRSRNWSLHLQVNKSVVPTRTSNCKWWRLCWAVFRVAWSCWRTISKSNNARTVWIHQENMVLLFWICSSSWQMNWPSESKPSICWLRKARSSVMYSRSWRKASNVSRNSWWPNQRKRLKWRKLKGRSVKVVTLVNCVGPVALSSFVPVQSPRVHHMRPRVHALQGQVHMHQPSVHVQLLNLQLTSNNFFLCQPRWWFLHWACLSVEKRRLNKMEPFHLNGQPFAIRWRYLKCRIKAFWNVLCQTLATLLDIIHQSTSNQCKFKLSILAFYQLLMLIRRRPNLWWSQLEWSQLSTAVFRCHILECIQCL